MLGSTETITFLVQGSAPEPYTVTFTKSDKRVNAFCTCPAGDNGQYCKHRVRILAGESTGIVSDNVKDIPTITAWMKGSTLESAFQKVRDAEHQLQQAERELSSTKKALAKVMHGLI